MPTAPVLVNPGGVAPPLAPTPPVAAEDVSKLDPNFAAAWNSLKPLFPGSFEGDNATIAVIAAIAYRYKGGGGPYTPTIGSISPTTTAHNVAFNLTVNGTLYDPGAAVEITLAGKTTVLRPSTISTPVQIIVAVPASAIVAAGTATVLVRNLDGTASTTTNLTVT